MSYIPAIYGLLDSNNSSTSTLTIGSTFTGTGTDGLNYLSINVSVTVDQSSTGSGMQFQHSHDNSNWDIVEKQTLSVPVAGTAFNVNFNLQMKARYFRVVYQNGATNQGVFRLQTILNGQAPASVVLDGTVSGLQKTRRAIECTSSGHLKVKLANPLSAFGDPRVIFPTPVSQFNFVYGINTNYCSSTTSTGGTATGTNSLGKVTTTTSSGSNAIIQSRKNFRYRDGMGGLGRFTALFTTGVAGNNQIAGCGDATDGYFFGYNGTSFGILYRRNSVDTWTSQASWSRDTLLGTGGSLNLSGMKLDPTKGNVYQIAMSYLGFGNIEFFVFNPDVNEFIQVHVLSYANQNTQTLLTNPALNLWWQTINSTGTSAGTSVSAGSGALFVDGLVKDLGAKYGKSSIKTNPGTSEIACITIKNNTTINSITNKSQITFRRLNFFTYDNGADGAVTCNIYLNTTLGGSPSYTNVDTTNSIAAYDTAGTTITGGTLVHSLVCSMNNVSELDLLDYDLFIAPGDTMTFSLTNATSSAACRTGVSVIWTEGT